jgi:hypothetical protein
MDYPAGEYHDSKEEARTVMKLFVSKKVLRAKPLTRLKAKDYMSFEASINPEEAEKERKKNFVKQEKKTAYFYCKYCDVAMNSVEQEDAHLDGKKHRKKRKQYNKLHGIVEDSPPRRTKKVTPPRYDSRSRSRSRGRGRGRSYSRSSSRSRSRSFSRSRSRSRGRTRSRSRSFSRGRSFTPPRKRNEKSKKGRRSSSQENGKRSPEKAKKKDKMKVPPVPQFNRFGERVSEVARLPSEERMGTVCGSPPRAKSRPKLKDRTPPRKRHRTPPRSKGSKRQKHRYSTSESSSAESSSSEDTDSDNSTTTIYTRKRYTKKKKSKR